VPIRPNRQKQERKSGFFVELVDRFLANMEVGLVSFTSCDVRLGYQLTFDASSTATLHYCLAGRGKLRLRNGPIIMMRQHTFVLLPPNVIYRIGAHDHEELGGVPRRRFRAPLFSESIPTIQAGHGELGIVWACGEVGVTAKVTPDLFAALDGPLVEQFGGPDQLRDQFVMLLAESARPGVGTRALTEALLKQCLVLLLRRRINRGEPAIPWMKALTDPGLARALQAMLERPSERFTLETLARLAGMSRSAFAARFTQTLKQTPMNLLKSARLSRARDLLLTTEMSVTQIARSVGFASRSNFSHAFRAAYGVDPSSYRTAAFKSPEPGPTAW